MSRVKPNERDPVSMRKAIQKLDVLTKVATDHHHTQHENGGTDEVSIAGLSGEAADVQKPKIDGLDEIGAALADGDELAVYDLSATANKKTLVSRIWTYVWAKVVALAAKATPIDADSVVVIDSADGNAGKLTTWTQVKAFLKTYFDTLYAASGGAPTAHAASHTNGSDDIQNATAAQKGLATAAQITKLDGIEALADVTDAANVAAAGAIMDGDFAANGAMERTGAGSYTTILNKRDATAAPTIGDDSGDGYAVGSRWVDVSNDKEYVCLDASVGAAVWTETTGGGTAGTVDRSINQFRLTLESGVPVSTTDQTAKTMVYACPVAGGAATEAQISLLGTDDTTWATHDTAQLSIGTTTTRNGTTTNGSAVITGLATTTDLVVGQEVTGTGVGAASVIASIDSATQITGTVVSTADGTVAVTFKCPAGAIYDTLCANIGGVPTLVFGPVWTNDTTRATAITQKDGVKVLSGAFSVGGTSYAEGRLRRVGGVGITATAGQTEFVYPGASTNGSFLIESEDNKKPVQYQATPAFVNNNAQETIAISSTTIAEINGGAGSRVTWFGDNVTCDALLAAALYNSNAGGVTFCGIGFDSVSTAKASAFVGGTSAIMVTCAHKPTPQTGRHYMAIVAWRLNYNGTYVVDGPSRYGGASDFTMSGLAGSIWL